MTVDVWTKISARISPSQPVELDVELFGKDAGKPRGRYLSRGVPANWRPPSKANWKMAEPDRVAIGVRVNRVVKDPIAVANRLIAMATERGVTPVIFSSIASSGFERFGFRVEHLGGANKAEQDACEAELKQFWDIAVVVDASDIVRMG